MAVEKMQVEQFRLQWKAIAEHASAHYLLHPEIEDFVMFPWLNGNFPNGKDVRLIDRGLEMQTGELSIDWLLSEGIRPHFEIGIEDSGISPARAQVKAAGKRGMHLHMLSVLKDYYNLPEGGLYSKVAVDSFTTQRECHLRVPIIRGILPSTSEDDMTAVICDDFIAHGHTGVQVCKALIEQGVRVLAYTAYAAKLYQNGAQRIANQFDIPVFPVVPITGIVNGRVEIADNPIVIRPES